MGYDDLAYDQALAGLRYLAGTDAMIIDVRVNGGGSGSLVTFLLSHFLGEQHDEEPILTFVSRESDTPSQTWAIDHPPAGRRTDIPLYILTSELTMSAAEALA
jgi:C-terminal processing protease CtpA/Prc